MHISKRKRKTSLYSSFKRKIAQVAGGGGGGGGKRSRWRKDTGIAKEGTDGTVVVLGWKALRWKGCTSNWPHKRAPFIESSNDQT